MKPRSDYENYYPIEKLLSELKGHKKRFEKVAEWCSGTVLDVGAGIGELIEYLKENPKVTEITAIDIKEEYVKYMQSRGINALIGDGRKLPFEDRSFDTVVATEILEHMENPGDLMKECIRIARKRFIFTTPSAKNCNDDWHFWDCNAENIGSWQVIEFERKENTR